MKCAVVCVKDDWKMQFWGLRYCLSKLNSLLSFPLGVTSHSKIAQFNWECIGALFGLFPYCNEKGTLHNSWRRYIYIYIPVIIFQLLLHIAGSVATRSKVCSLWLTEIVDSNSTGGMHICLLWMLCVLVRCLCDDLITRPEESYRLWWVAVCELENLIMSGPWHV